MAADFTVADGGLSDDVAADARQIPVQDRPDEVMPFLPGSRCCDTDKLAQTAWWRFGGVPRGWGLARRGGHAGSAGAGGLRPPAGDLRPSPRRGSLFGCARR